MFFPSVEFFEAEGTLSLPMVRAGLLPVFAQVSAIGKSLATSGTGMVPLRARIAYQTHLMLVIVMRL